MNRKRIEIQFERTDSLNVTNPTSKMIEAAIIKTIVYFIAPHIL